MNMKNYNYFEEKNEKIPSRMKFFIYWIITSDNYTSNKIMVKYKCFIIRC